MNKGTDAVIPDGLLNTRVSWGDGLVHAEGIWAAYDRKRKHLGIILGNIVTAIVSVALAALMASSVGAIEGKVPGNEKPRGVQSGTSRSGERKMEKPRINSGNGNGIGLSAKRLIPMAARAVTGLSKQRAKGTLLPAGGQLGAAATDKRPHRASHCNCQRCLWTSCRKSQH